MDKNIVAIAKKLSIQEWQVENTIRLLDEGSSVPFISRYRKEMTGSLDEVTILNIKDQYEKLKELDKRREAVIRSVEDQEKMTPVLLEKIMAAASMPELEDIYLPYRPRRRTRATIARENGLEPLAMIILEQEERNPESRAESFTGEKVPDVDSALAGACDIIAEIINENQKARISLRRLMERDAVITSKVVRNKETEGIKYSDYFDLSEQLKRTPSHRLLAMMRGEDEGFLRFQIAPRKEEEAIELLERLFVRGNNRSTELVKRSVEDCYKRLLLPSLETEFRNSSKERADEEAISVFASNLRQLLLASPLGEKRVLALDPGYRTGCKVVCLDAQGNLVHNETIYPHPPQNQTALSVKKIMNLVEIYKIEAIAVGNGTAGRETEEFIRWIKFDRELQIYLVDESGASVYSASEVARDEFPEYDVTVRGSVSIGRRLVDPLAELVKIDPKSIGVGQYQHDVNQQKLQQSLDDVVMSCVNSVGVEVNTSSKHLLSYVSGLGPQLAKNIVEYRRENGPFRSRTEMMKVKRMGDKAFEQAAGFLRIRNAENPLDASSVHPESYHIVAKMASDMSCSVSELISNADKIKEIRPGKYVTDTVGLPTLKDILQELAKPGRDPRGEIEEFRFADIHSVDDLKEGEVVPGIITNITKFGAFVDIGVKQDGLVHISNLTNRFVSDPASVVKLRQHVRVKIMAVDRERNRIQLSMKNVEQS